MRSFLKLTLTMISLCGFRSEAFALSYISRSEGLFTTIHILVVDPKINRIELVKAESSPLGRETVTALVHKHRAIAGINGGFWKLNGKPAGILKIGPQWYGTPFKPRAALGWAMHGEIVLIDRLLTSCDLDACPNGDGITILPASEPPVTTAEQWNEMDYIVGGAPVLIQKDKIIKDFTSEQTLPEFILQRHPRTAVGIRENGEWVFVAVDGRLCGFLGGMTIDELALLMQGLGCFKALNLDGGGSTTMVFEGQVVNRTCGEILEDGKNVRAVSDAILIY